MTLFKVKTWASLTSILSFTTIFNPVAKQLSLVGVRFRIDINLS